MLGRSRGIALWQSLNGVFVGHLRCSAKIVGHVVIQSSAGSHSILDLLDLVEAHSRITDFLLVDADCYLAFFSCHHFLSLGESRGDSSRGDLAVLVGGVALGAGQLVA